jgi:heme/copper-type cytochrome/quinol oxidase subunit 2
MSFINEALGSTQLSLLWICALAAAMVFVALVYSTATFRPASNASDLRGRNVLREVVWTAVPILIVVAAALPAMTGAVPSQAERALREATLVTADSHR